MLIEVATKEKTEEIIYRVILEEGEKVDRKSANKIMEYVKTEIAQDFDANVEIVELDEEHIHDPLDTRKILRGQKKQRV